MALKYIKSRAIFESEQLDESRYLTVKRRYTEKHPEINVGKHAPVRETILQFIDSKGTVTKEELSEFINKTNEETGSKTDMCWVRRNARYIKETSNGFELSKLGKRVVRAKVLNEGRTERTIGKIIKRRVR